MLKEHTKKKLRKLVLDLIIAGIAIFILLKLVGIAILFYIYIKPIPVDKLAIEPDLSKQVYYDLGVKHQNGDGVEKNIEKAGAYFAKAAELGSEKAIHRLTKNDHSCRAGLADLRKAGYEDTGFAKALETCRLYAASGNLDTQLALGATYMIKGDGRQARKWFEAAAKQGHVMAQYEMAKAYSKGVYIHNETVKEILDDPEIADMTIAYGWLCLLEKQIGTPGSPGLEMWRQSGAEDKLWPVKSELDREADKFISGWMMKKMCNHYVDAYYKEPEPNDHK